MLHEGVIFSAGNAADVLTGDNIARVYGVDAAVGMKDGFLHVIPLRPV